MARRPGIRGGGAGVRKLCKRLRQGGGPAINPSGTGPAKAEVRKIITALAILAIRVSRLLDDCAGPPRKSLRPDNSRSSERSTNGALKNRYQVENMVRARFRSVIDGILVVLRSLGKANALECDGSTFEGSIPWISWRARPDQQTCLRPCVGLAQASSTEEFGRVGGICHRRFC